MLRVNHLGFGTKPPKYRANAVNFDGTSDYLSKSSGLTGASDGKIFTIAFWLNYQDGDTHGRIIRGWNSSSLQRFFVNRDATANNLYILVANTSGGTALSVTSGTNDPNGAGWICHLASFDMANSGKRHYYWGDTDVMSVATYNNQTLDLTCSNWGICANPDGSSITANYLADFRMWFGTYIDFSVVANRRLFIDTQGKPAHRDFGNIALGTPIIQLSGPTSSWHTNDGSGGGFTEVGALTTAPSSPSD